MKTNRITLLRRPWRMPNPTLDGSRTAVLERKTRSAYDRSSEPLGSHADLRCASPRKHAGRPPL